MYCTTQILNYRNDLATMSTIWLASVVETSLGVQIFSFLVFNIARVNKLVAVDMN